MLVLLQFPTKGEKGGGGKRFTQEGKESKDTSLIAGKKFDVKATKIVQQKNSFSNVLI